MTEAKLEEAFPGQGATLWRDLIVAGWMTTIPGGAARIVDPLPKPKGKIAGLDQAEVQLVLSKVAASIRPIRRDAVFEGRPVVRDGWLTLAPKPDNPEP